MQSNVVSKTEFLFICPIKNHSTLSFDPLKNHKLKTSLSSLYHKRSNFDNSDEDKSSTLGVDWAYLLLLPRLEEWRTIICCQVDVEDFYTE